MSIHDIGSKIKGRGHIGHPIALYTLVILGVAFSSFQLGRLSIKGDDIGNRNTSSAINTIDRETEISDLDNLVITDENNQSKNNYVASKNGKLYYTPSCGGAKRIKPENQVWFSTSSDAEKSGYQFSTSCK